MATRQLFVTDRGAVIKSFGKTDKDILKDTDIIRKWVKTQPHLPEVPSANMIETFLMTNKFSIETTKQKLDMYYTIRSRLPQLYKDSNPKLPLMQEVPNKMSVLISLPKQTKEHYRVYLVKFLKNPEDFDTNKFLAHALNVLEMKLQHDVTASEIFIVDWEYLKMGHVAKITPMHIKNLATIMEKVFSNRIKRIHLINCPSFVDIIISICKTMLKPKLFNRIRIHQTIEELYKYVPKEILPKDYGGDEDSIQKLIELWKDCFRENSGRFDELDKMKVKEELRPTPLKNDEILGYHGSFKALDVD